MIHKKEARINLVSLFIVGFVYIWVSLTVKWKSYNWNFTNWLKYILALVRNLNTSKAKESVLGIWKPAAIRNAQYF